MEKRNIIKKGNETKYYIYIYVCTTTKKTKQKTTCPRKQILINKQTPCCEWWV